MYLLRGGPGNWGVTVGWDEPETYPEEMVSLVSSVFRISRRALRSIFVILLASSPSAAEPLPTVESLLKGSPFSAEDIENVLSGEVVVTTVKYESDRELAVGLACLVEPGVDPIAAFDRPKPMLPSDGIKDFERVDPANARPAFEKLQLRDESREELQRFMDFESGLGLNMSPAEIERFNALSAAHPAPIEPGILDRTVQELLQQRVDAYRKRGLAGIAPYVREEGKLVSPAEELEKIVDQSESFRRLFPRFMEMWMVFPRTQIPGSDESYFWVRSVAADRPMLMLTHKVEWREENTRLMGERIFYVSHFFNAGHTNAVATETKEGRLFALVSRLWVDGYSGMSGVKHSLGEELVEGRLLKQVDRRDLCVAD